jgi:hypothetical protein
MNELGDRFMDKGETAYAAKVDSIVAYTGYESLEIEIYISSSRIDRIRIYWNDYNDFTDIQTGNQTGVFKTLIENLEEKSYLLNVVSIDSYGNTSLPVELTGEVIGDNYLSSLRNRSVSSAVYASGTLTLAWSNAPNSLAFSELLYTDISGNEKSMRIYSDELSTSIPDWSSNPDLASTLRQRAAFQPANSIDTFYTAWQTIGDIIFSDNIFSIAKARWQFDDPLDITKASIGSPLIRQGDGFTPVKGPKAGDGAVRVAKGSYFNAPHGIAANGGARVNSYSVMFDFKVSELGRYYSFIQTTLENNDDADFFINRNGQFGVGGTGYSEHVVSTGEWHRLVISASMGNAYLYYLDGTLIHTGNVGNASVDSRWSWLPEGVLFFADEDGEDAEMDVANIIVWDKALSEAEVSSLGGVDEGEKPLLSVKAYWQFDDPSDFTKATTGQPLEAAGTGFTAVDGGVRVGIGSYYTARHGIAANGGGNRVNEYTVMFDYKLTELTGGVWYGLIQTDLNNSGDNDIWIDSSSGQIGCGDTGYSSGGAVPIENANYHRIVVSVKLPEYYKIYVDGVLKLNAASGTDNNRRSLDPNGVLLFADASGWDTDIDISNVAVWDRALSETEVTALGGVE